MCVFYTYTEHLVRSRVIETRLFVRKKAKALEIPTFACIFSHMRYFENDVHIKIKEYVCVFHTLFW